MRIAGLLFVAMSLYGQSPADRAWQLLDGNLHDNNPIKRRQAVVAMEVLRPDTRTVAALEAALGDKEMSVREAACVSLGEINARASIPKLHLALEDASPEVIFAAARSLYRLGDPTGRQVLSAIVLGEQKDASGAITTSVHDAKMKLHDPKSLLLIGIRDASGFAGPAGMGIPFAMDLMKDNQASGKTVAVLLLATDTWPESLQVLKGATGDKNWTVRVAATRAIAQRNATMLYENVASLLDDKRDEVRFAAAAAILRLKQK